MKVARPGNVNTVEDAAHECSRNCGPPARAPQKPTGLCPLTAVADRSQDNKVEKQGI